MCLEHGNKSQASLLIAIGLIAIFIVLLIINIFSRAVFESRVTGRIGLSKISSYLDFSKGFSRTALLFSVHTGTKTVAGFGGEVSKSGPPRNWICNFDVSPSVDEVRYFLSNQTLEYLNRYLTNMKIEDVTQIIINNFTCVDYDVSERSVFFGQNDEAFNVSALGSKINISLGENQVHSSNEIYEEIEKVRFWYMYRKFKEWARSTNLRSYVAECEPILCKYFCGKYYFFCSSDSELYNCVKKAVNKAVDELNKIFDDEYVKCKGTLTCCHATALACEPPPGCQHCCSCGMEKPGELCGKEYVSFSNFVYTPEAKGPYLRFQADEDVYWQGDRLDVEAEFSCKDEKYLLSVAGERMLIFQVYTTINIVVSEDCLKIATCELCP